jgi:hypothetical protein
MLKLSSTVSQRWAHQLSPNDPRCDCDRMPPWAARGRDGGK